MTICFYIKWPPFKYCSSLAIAYILLGAYHCAKSRMSYDCGKPVTVTELLLRMVYVIAPYVKVMLSSKTLAMWVGPICCTTLNLGVKV